MPLFWLLTRLSRRPTSASVSRILFLSLCVSLLAGGCHSAATRPGPDQSSAPPATVQTTGEALPTPSPTASATPAPPTTADPSPTPDPVAGLIRTMSPREKIGQLIMAGFDAPDDAVHLIRDLRLGGVILFKRNIATEDQTARDIATLQQAVMSGLPPLFVAVDQEGGRVSRLPASSGPFPSARSIGDHQDPQLAYQAGLDTGRILLRFGFNMNLAPVLDIASNPQNTVIGTRAFGTTAESVIAAGLPFMNGLEASGILAAVKHFPGHGDTRIDSHVALPVVDKSLAQLHQLELRPFAEAIAQNAALIMVAHLVLSELDSRPASLSPLVVDGLLRAEMGYAGVVITDDLIMGAISQYATIGEAAVLAVLAGCDIVLVGAGSANLQTVHAALLEALHSGRLSQERLDLSLARILQLKRRLGTSGALME